MLIMMLCTLYDRQVCACVCVFFYTLQCISANMMSSYCRNCLVKVSLKSLHESVTLDEKIFVISYFLISFFFTLSHFLFFFDRMHLNQTIRTNAIQTTITMFVQALFFLRLNAAHTNFRHEIKPNSQCRQIRP